MTICTSPSDHRATRFSVGAFSLVEVTVALGIFSFALVAILGVLPVGLNTADSAFRQSDVTSVMSSATAAIRGMQWDGDDLKTGGWLAAGGVELPISEGEFAIGADGSVDGADPRYDLKIDSAGDITWPGVHRATLTVSWPSGAANPLGEVETTIFVHIPRKENP